MTNYTTIFRVFTRFAVFPILILTVSLVTLIILLVSGGRRIKFSELEKQMGGGKKGKDKGKDNEKGGASNSNSGMLM